MRRAALLLPLLLTLLLAPVVASLVAAWGHGWTFAEVTTGSMRPGMSAGSLAVLSPVAPSDVAVGDVIGFRDEHLSGVVTHRVVAVLEQPSGRFFTTQGDANARPDGRPVPARAVVGEVRWRIAGLGSVVGGLGDRSVQLALAGVPFGVLVLSEVVGWRGRRLGKVIAALRMEIERLRSADLQPDRALERGERVPERVVVVVPTIRPAPVPVPPPGRRIPTDGSGCLAGVR